MVERQGPGKTMHRSLRRGVRCNPALAGMPLYRREIDNGPAAPLPHLWNSEMPQKIDAADVHHQTSVPLLQTGFHHGTKGMKGRCIYNYVESAKLTHRFRDHIADGIRQRDVTPFYPQAQPI